MSAALTMIAGTSAPTAPIAIRQGRPYWAVLGADLDEVTTYEQALAQAGLDWGLLTTPMNPAVVVDAVPSGDTEAEPEAVIATAPDRRLLIHAGTHAILGMVGSRSEPVTNAESFAVTEVLADRGARWVAGGTVDHGRTCFMLMRPRHSTITVTDADGNVEQILVDVQIRTGHGGKESLSYELRATRETHQTSVAVKASSSMFPGVDPVIRVRHTASAATRMQDASAMLASAARYTDGFAKVARKLIGTPLSAVGFGRMLDVLWPKPQPKSYGDFEDRVDPANRAKDDAAHERRVKNWEARRAAVVGLFKAEAFAADTGYCAFVSVARYLEWGRAARGRTTEQAAASRAFNDTARDDRSRALALLLDPQLNRNTYGR